MTVRSFRRRLGKMLLQANGVLIMGEQGCPPILHGPDTLDATTGLPRPVVIDLHSLGAGAAGYAVQRFVVAALLRQMELDRTRPDADPALRYLVCLDELNRYAPAKSDDPITAYLEYVAAELRSMGVILISAQQQASLVSARVLQNCATRLIGRTDAGELLTPAFSFLTPALRALVAKLQPGELLLVQPTFEFPAAISCPFPPWAMRRSDCLGNPAAADAAGRVVHRTPLATGAVRAQIRLGDDD